MAHITDEQIKKYYAQNENLCIISERSGRKLYTLYNAERAGRVTRGFEAAYT